MAAAPLRTVRAPAAVAGAAAVAAAAPLPAPSTSALVIRPPGPVPGTPLRSTPSAAATRAATGVTLVPSGAAAGAPLVAGAGAAAGAGPAAGAAPAPLVEPACMRAIVWPTVT